MNAITAPASRTFRLATRLAHAEHTGLDAPLGAPSGEDRWSSDARTGRWVLCDGASEGWDSGTWAGALARELARSGSCQEAIPRARRRFSRLQGEPGDWLDDRSRKRGSWSTALVVTQGTSGRSLEAEAVGDTTLFILSGFDTVLSFPIEDAASFGNTPELIGDSGDVLPRFEHIAVPLARVRRPSFALATDALAARLLSADKAERRELWRFFATTDSAAFQTWASREMEEGKLARDDLTLLWVR